MGSSKYAVIDEILGTGTDLSQVCCVEIGSERGEGSTAWLHTWCVQHGMEFWTCDFDPAIADNARTLTPNVICAKGEEWLTKSPPQKPVAFAYLDNFDWIFPKNVSKPWRLQTGRYLEIDGTVMNNVNSQATHFAQANALLPLFAPHAFVLFDDTWRYDTGEYDGNGWTAVPFLLANGFSIISEKVTPEIGTRDIFDGWVLLRRG